MVGPVNVKKIYAKCEEKKFGQLHDQSNKWSVWTIWSVVFPGIFGFRGVNISKVKNPGKRHDLQRKCKMKQTTYGWIREIVGV